MKHLLLNTALLSLLTIIATPLAAQERAVSKPLFITPYTVNEQAYSRKTINKRPVVRPAKSVSAISGKAVSRDSNYDSRPAARNNVNSYQNKYLTMVQPTSRARVTRSNRNYTNPNRVSKKMYDDPLELPATFGRITGERDFYDAHTKRYHNQYDYFALMASRGDTEGFNASVKKVQETGVFNPEKFREAMSKVKPDDGGENTSTRSIVNKPIMAVRDVKKDVSTSSLHAGGTSSSVNSVSISGNRVRVNTGTPQLSHAGYGNGGTRNSIDDKRDISKPPQNLGRFEAYGTRNISTQDVGTEPSPRLNDVDAYGSNNAGSARKPIFLR